MLTHDVSDEMLGIVLHSKLNAIAEGAVNIYVIDISNKTAPFSHTFSMITPGPFLPDIESIIGKTAYHDKPWWCRNDTFTFDKFPGKDKELKEPPEEAFTFADLFDYTIEQPTNKAGEVIKLEKWKPKLV